MSKIVILFLDQDSSMYLHLTLMDLHSECKICCSKIQHNKNHSIERCINAMIKKYVPFPMQCYTNIVTVLILKFKNMFNFQFKKSKNGPKKIDG